MKIEHHLGILAVWPMLNLAIRIYKFVKLYKIFHYLIWFQNIILPNPKQYLWDRGFSPLQEATSSLGRKQSRARKARQTVYHWCSAQAPGTVPIVNTERSAERDLAKQNQTRARKIILLASQESGVTPALLPGSVATTCRTDVTQEEGPMWKAWCRRSVGAGSQPKYIFCTIKCKVQPTECSASQGESPTL